jgi:hypothetical protein
MKKIIFAIGLLAFTSAAFAQQPDRIQPVTEKSDIKVKPNEFVEMREGKVWLTRDGKTTLVSGIISIGGTRISSDGIVELTDGTKVKLRDGDRITADGKLVKPPVDKMPQEEPYKTPDN